MNRIAARPSGSAGWMVEVGSTRSRWLSQLIAATASVLAVACGTPLSAVRISPALRSESPQLRVEVSEIRLSTSLRQRDFSESTRILVVARVTALGSTSLDLSAARLRLGADPERAPVATGTDEAPTLLEDDVYAAPVALGSGQSARVWFAFGNFAPRTTREIPERVELRFAESPALVLSNPGNPPIWTGDPVASSGTVGGVWFQASADEGAVNLEFYGGNWLLGPVTLVTRAGVGVRSARLEDPFRSDLVCCNLAFALNVGMPLYADDTFVVSPFAGVEGAVFSGDRDEKVLRRTWIGPALGVNLGLGPLSSRHGPFPIHYPASPLTAYNIHLSLVHWFGDGRDAPSFGVVGGWSARFGR